MENEFVSNLFGWMTLILIVLLVLYQPLQKLFCQFTGWTVSMSRLKAFHKILGILVVFTALIHGKTIVGREGLGLGIIAFLLLLILPLTYLLRNFLKKSWVRWHGVISILLLVVVILHIWIAL